MRHTLVFPVYEYYCDVCGKLIPTGLYDEELVTLTFDRIHSGIGDYSETIEAHICRDCLKQGVDIWRLK